MKFPLIPRKKNSDKSKYGHVLIVAGSRGMAGAAVLAARAALFSGAGLVTLAVPKSLSARILAAADAFKALTSDRPWRTRLAPDAAARTLGAEVKEGKLAHDAVEAVLGVAGHGDNLRRQTWPSGLSDREIDVLRLISLGRTNREVAERLFISPKTVGRHIENIYAKIGVSTRPAATLFAMQHQLLS